MFLEIYLMYLIILTTSFSLRFITDLFTDYFGKDSLSQR